MVNKKPVTITEFARLGGLARAAKLTKKRRVEIAKKAAAAATKQRKSGAK